MSKAEQTKRLLSRLDDSTKNWKFSMSDVRERAHWDDYISAYQHAIAATATPETPWYIVPADKKWFTRLVVVEAICDALARRDLKPIPLPQKALADLSQARKLLEGGK